VCTFNRSRRYSWQRYQRCPGDIVGGSNEDDIYQRRRGFVPRDGAYSTFGVPGAGFTDIFAINKLAREGRHEYLDFDGLIYGFLIQPGPRLSSYKWHREFQAELHMVVTLGLNDFGRRLWRHRGRLL
jgi:hypothetical protein